MPRFRRIAGMLATENVAACPDRRISIRMNVATAISMNPAKGSRKTLSTVSTAEASTIRKARIGQRDVVAIAAQRERPHYHGEQRQMHRRGQEDSRE